MYAIFARRPTYCVASFGSKSDKIEQKKNLTKNKMALLLPYCCIAHFENYKPTSRSNLRAFFDHGL